MQERTAEAELMQVWRKILEPISSLAYFKKNSNFQLILTNSLRTKYSCEIWWFYLLFVLLARRSETFNKHKYLPVYFQEIIFLDSGDLKRDKQSENSISEFLAEHNIFIPFSDWEMGEKFSTDL